MNEAIPHRAATIDVDHSIRAAHGRSLRGDYGITAVGVGALALFFMRLSESVMHWFLLPLIACGILAGVDIVRWLRGRLDLFDPRTIIACLAFYGLFVAPILHVVWDRFGAGYDMDLWGDWRPWLGAMAALNAAGLLVYRWTHNWIFRRTTPPETVWEVERQRFHPVFASALTLSAAGVVYYLWQFGGPSGVVEAFESNQEAFVGKGWLLVLAWPLAVLSFIVLALVYTDRPLPGGHHLAKGIVLLSAAGMGHFILMGWYGSRSATVWALFWMAGIVHYRFHKLSPRWMGLGVILLIAFMYFYGFYKEQGRSGFDVMRSPARWFDPGSSKRDVKFLLLGDLARADSNAYILHNLVKDPGEYDYRWGLTYAGAFIILVPRNFWPDRPEFKVEAGTEAQLGKAGPWRSSRVYGLSGEALLNFGPGGVVPMFAIYGSLLGWYRRKLVSWQPQDSRFFLAPFFTMLLASALVSDSDNLVYAAVTQGALVIAAVSIASRRSALLATSDEITHRD